MLINLWLELMILSGLLVLFCALAVKSTIKNLRFKKKISFDTDT